jgi:hypothetical protein
MKFSRRKICYDWRLLLWDVCTVLVALLLLSQIARAEINVPSNVEPYKPIVISVSPAGIPDGAQVRGSVTCSTADLLPGPSGEVWHCWAKPGTHSVVASGVWVLTQPVQVGEQSVPVLVDFGQYSESAFFTVGGDTPTPPPTPNPKKKWLVIVEESSKRTPKYANLYNKLRASNVARVVIADQHDDSDAIRRYVDEIPDGAYLPWLFIVDKDGKVLDAKYIPDTTTVDAIKGMLQ